MIKKVLAWVLMVLALACIGETCYKVLAGSLEMFEPRALVAYPFHAVCMICACLLLVPMRVPTPGEQVAPEPQPDDQQEAD